MLQSALIYTNNDDHYMVVLTVKFGLVFAGSNVCRGVGTTRATTAMAAPLLLPIIITLLVEGNVDCIINKLIYSFTRRT